MKRYSKLLGLALALCLLAGCSPETPESSPNFTLPVIDPVISESTRESTAAPEESSTPAESEVRPTESAVSPTAPEQTTEADPVPVSPITVPEDVSRTILDEGGWYPGKFVRDLATGEVKCEWDRPAAVYELLEKYNGIYHKNKDQKVIYLTFDCGGTSSVADVSSILDTLKAKNVKAIFFIPGDFFCGNLNREGEYIQQDKAALLRRIVDEGHLLGNHTYTHPSMPKQTDEGVISQLNTQQERIDQALGYHYTLKYYRPPEGATSERDLYIAKAMGYSTVFWGYAYMDYSKDNQMDVPTALNKAEVGLHDGCVYLLHALSSTNQAMLGDLIDFARGQGYDIRRIDE